MDPTLIFTDYTLRTVTLGALILGALSGTLGSYAVLRRQALLGDAMSHAALPGIVLAFMITGTKVLLFMIIGAILAGWLGAILISVVIRRTRIKEDTALGIVLSVFFGFGLLLLTYVQRTGGAQQAGLDTFLFGKAAAMIAADVWTMGSIGAITLVLVFLLWKEFKLLSFDPDFAASLGYNVRRLDLLLTTLIVVAIVIGLQTVGVVLMSAMVVAPAAAARQWTDRLGLMVLLSSFFGMLAGALGAVISALSPGLSTGPVIVLCISVIVLLSMFVAPNRGLLWGRWRQRHRHAQLRAVAVLDDLYRLGMAHGDPHHAHPLGTLRAARPEGGVRGALEELRAQGWVERTDEQWWRLTDEGVVALQDQRDGRASESGAGDGAPADRRSR